MSSQPEAPSASLELIEHPAVRAWAQLRPLLTEPQAIHPLKADRRKTGIFRLVGVGPGGSNVIAKRRAAGTLSLLREGLIYEEILRGLPVPALRCYGFVHGSQGDFDWLFFEDAGDQDYSLTEDHRVLAGQWLGTVHIAAAELDIARRLPELGPNHYLQLLESVRDMLGRSSGNSSLLREDLAILEGIRAECDRLAARWVRVEEICNRIPWSLVHGDLAKKNLRVRTEQDHDALLVFDWETAGWGVPCADLAQFTLRSASPDLRTYWTVVRRQWPHATMDDIQHLADLGKIFRLLAAISWDAWTLEGDRVDGYLRSMREYWLDLAESLRAALWLR